MTKVYQNIGILSALAQAASIYLVVRSRFNLFSSEESDQERIHQSLTWITHLILPFLIFVAKKIEGWNLSIFPNTLCTVALFIAVRFSWISFLFYPFIILAIFFLVLHIICLKTFFYFKFLQPKGPFNVGFTYLPYKGLRIAIFYPTARPSGNRARFFFDSYPLDGIYALATAYETFPRSIFNLWYDYGYKIEMPAHLDSPLLSPQMLESRTLSNRFTPIVVSPATGLHRNAYSSYCSEFASRGHIVISLNHDEDIRELSVTKEVEVRRKHLAKRVHEVRMLLDSLQNGQLLFEVFKAQVPLAFDKTIVMGHAFGGATALATAYEDRRVNDVVLLDPWLAAMHKEEITRPLHCNMLLVESEYWSDWAVPYFEVRSLNQAFINAQRYTGKRAIYTIGKRVDHLSFSDSCLVYVGYLKMFQFINHKEEQRELLSFLVDVVSMYIELSVHGDPTDKFIQSVKADKRLVYE